LKEKYPNTIVVDGGNMSLPERASATVMPLLKAMGYCAIGVGASDQNHLGKYILAAKDAGIQMLDTPAKEQDGLKPYIVQKVGNKRVGILSFGYVRPNEDNLDLRKSRYIALKEAREKCDVLILLDQAGIATESWLQRQASRLGVPDVVIGGQQTLLLGNKPKVVGKTWILPATSQTKVVGLLNMTIETGKDPQMEYSQGTLDDKVAEDQNVKKALVEYNNAESARVQAQSRAVNQMRPDSKTAPVPGQPAPAVSGAYYDSKMCAECHKTQHESWSASKHAIAVKTLVDRGKDVPSCLSCHSERYRQTQAYMPIDEKWKQGVECASCHIKVLPHGADGPDKNIAKPGIDLDTCRVCHTKDQSPEFDAKSKEYWQKAKHKPVKQT